GQAELVQGEAREIEIQLEVHRRAEGQGPLKLDAIAPGTFGEPEGKGQLEGLPVQGEIARWGSALCEGRRAREVRLEGNLQVLEGVGQLRGSSDDEEAFTVGLRPLELEEASSGERGSRSQDEHVAGSELLELGRGGAEAQGVALDARQSAQGRFIEDARSLGEHGAPAARGV